MGLFIWEAIEDYTGLSPTAFFTILALMFGVYQLVSSMFAFEQHDLNKPAAAAATKEASLQNDNNNNDTSSTGLGLMSEEELQTYDGSDPNKPLLMAIKGHVYDVSPSRLFYGPGGPYALFAGRDASRALALMSFDPNDLTGNIEGLEPSELEVLQDWEYKFQEKYAKVGQIVTENTRNGDTASLDRTDGNVETARDAPIWNSWLFLTVTRIAQGVT